MGKEWCGLPAEKKQKVKNIQGVNLMPDPDVPKPGMQHNRWTR
jgi:hypothetical protein